MITGDAESCHDVVLAVLGNIRMECVRSYVARGRRFSAKEIGYLVTEWSEQMHALADCAEGGRVLVGNRFDQTLFEDLNAEFELRGVELPIEQVGSAMERIRQKIRADEKLRCCSGALADRANQVFQGQFAKLRGATRERN